MTTTLYFYGSAFELSATHDDDTWRAIIQDRFDLAKKDGVTIAAWFDLARGGHVTLPLAQDTPLAIVTS